MALTLVEKTMLEALEIVRDYLTGKSVTVEEYTELMNIVRKGVNAGHNKRDTGCPSGLHSVDCTCKEEKPGISQHYARYRKRETNE